MTLARELAALSDSELLAKWIYCRQAVDNRGIMSTRRKANSDKALVELTQLCQAELERRGLEQ